MANSSQTSYPRPGEPLAPRLLRSLFDEVTAELDPEVAPLFRDGAEIWRRLTPAAGAELGQLFVRRVQGRLASAPRTLLDTALPPPAVVLAHLPLERRTRNTLRRCSDDEAQAPDWTVERYLRIPRFGARALVDILAALDARALGAPLAVAPAAPLAAPRPSEGVLQRAIAIVTRRLPISQDQANQELTRAGLLTHPIDLADLAHATARAGRDPPFRVLDIAGARIAVGPAQMTAAGAAYAIASRAVYNWGATTVRGVSHQVCVVLSLVISAVFVERLLTAVSSFEWLDREGGWFWFTGRPNRLLGDLRKVFAVATRVPLARLWQALTRAGVGPEPPPPPVLGRICATIPGAAVAGDVVVVGPPLAAAAQLSPAESRLVQILRESGPVPAADLRRLGHAAGLSRPTLRRLMRASPLLERLPDRSFSLVGTSSGTSGGSGASG
jgi:hypothetical protein